MTVNEAIPGTCDPNVPRKLGGIAVDPNLTVHIALGRNNIAGSMLYYQRSNAGVWTVQGEALPSGCAPTDMAITVSTQGTPMVAWKDCGAGGQGTDMHTATRLAPNNWQDDDISAPCCSGCPNVSSAYLPAQAADPFGGIRAAWADGRCVTNGPTDIYYREWIPGSGWNGQPIVQIVENSGTSYYPTITVDDSGEAYIAWGDDTDSPFCILSHFLQSWARHCLQRARNPLRPVVPGFMAARPIAGFRVSSGAYGLRQHKG